MKEENVACLSLVYAASLSIKVLNSIYKSSFTFLQSNSKWRARHGVHVYGLSFEVIV